MKPYLFVYRIGNNVHTAHVSDYSRIMAYVRRVASAYAKWWCVVRLSDGVMLSQSATLNANNAQAVAGQVEGARAKNVYVLEVATHDG